MPGLYAAGEASSGLFGACRVADATTEMMVQGNRAGISASQYALSASVIPVDESQVREILQKINAPLTNTQGVNPLETIQKIHRVADAGFGSARNEEDLTKALAELNGYKMKICHTLWQKANRRIIILNDLKDYANINAARQLIHNYRNLGIKNNISFAPKRR